MNGINQRIKNLMARDGLTMTELAKKTGLSRSTISRYLSGKVEPKRNAIGAIAKAFHVDPVWLAGFDVPASDYTAETPEGTASIEVEHFNELSPENIKKVENYVKKLYELQKMEEGEET